MKSRTDAAPHQPVPLGLTRSLRGSEHRLVLAAGDLTAAMAAAVASLWVWSIAAGAHFSWAFGADKLPWLAAVLLWMLAAGLPSSHPSVAFSVPRTLAVLLRGAAGLGVVYLVVYFYAPRDVLPRLAALCFLWEVTLQTLAWRLIFIALFGGSGMRLGYVLVGTGASAVLAAELMRGQDASLDPPTVVAIGGELPEAFADMPVVPTEGLLERINQGDIGEIVLALDQPPQGALLQALLQGQELGIALVRVQTLIEQTLRRVPVDLLEHDWLLTDLADTVRLRDASWLGKRALDIVGATLGVLACAAVAPAIAVAIRLDSPGPIFYSQRRIGRGGVPFTLVKFRTMQANAEPPGQAQWATAHDRRVTRVGRFLRRTRLDELPQFWSIVKGDMSLVGPRPERGQFVAQLQRSIPFYRARLMVPPGLTGWAQVNLPYGDSEDAARAKLEYDLYYVKNRSLLFDCAILLRTVATVLRFQGH